jgi:hypothetical protein
VNLIFRSRARKPALPGPYYDDEHIRLSVCNTQEKLTGHIAEAFGVGPPTNDDIIREPTFFIK